MFNLRTTILLGSNLELILAKQLEREPYTISRQLRHFFERSSTLNLFLFFFLKRKISGPAYTDDWKQSSENRSCFFPKQGNIQNPRPDCQGESAAYRSAMSSTQNGNSPPPTILLPPRIGVLLQQDIRNPHWEIKSGETKIGEARAKRSDKRLTTTLLCATGLFKNAQDFL